MTSPRLRCAIYTRKSTDEGLDQDFNSLDAQYEACAAYIASQRGEGWRALPERYDDGGVSGGTLERPALQRLLAEIDAGRVEMIVVYKIDRLTRSLADFARLVDRLETAGCSFVSVTQSFNTATSMGRLTLNMLLSFAQFEREVIAERVRDKIAASKQKGLWMGGLAPLGYEKPSDPKLRRLVVNAGEAETVRTIFLLYDEKGCLRRVAEEAERIGIRSKRRVFESGATRGGGALTRGQIHYLLTNPVYLGKIRHKDQVHDGQHEAIVDAALWDRVQRKLRAASGRKRGARDPSSAAAPLTGKLFDETGDRLTPTHASKAGRRYRYYVSSRQLRGPALEEGSGWRLPAAALEKTVARIVADHLEALSRTQRLVAHPEAATAGPIAAEAARLAEGLRTDATGSLGDLIARACIAPDEIAIQLNPAVLADAIDAPAGSLADHAIAISAPLRLRRRGVETRLVAGEREAAPDQTLIRRLAEAHRWVDDLRAGEPLLKIAATDGHSPAYIRTRAPLAFLSPRIQKAILAGEQPADLSLAKILRAGVSLDWAEQERVLGFEP